MRTHFHLFFIAVCVLLSFPAAAHEINHVSGSPYYWEEHKENPFGLKLNFGFGYENYAAAINKEYQGNGDLQVVRDLQLSRTTTTFNVGAEAGIKGVAFFLNLPVILSQQSVFKFQGGARYPNYDGYAECVAAHTGVGTDGKVWLCNPDGVNALNSRTVLEEIAAGMNFSDVPGPGEPGVRTLYSGPKRSGLDQLHLGLRWNVPVFNQFQDHTKPYWVLSVDLGLPIGDPKDFRRSPDGMPLCAGGVRCTDPQSQRPQLNSAVGRGVYDITLASTMSKRSSIFDSYFRVWATLPFAYTSDSLYAGKYDFSGDWGAKAPSAPIRGGLEFGSDFNVYQDNEKKFRINAFATGSITGVFEGQDYSEAYEVLAGSPTLNFGCGTNPAYPNFCGDSRLNSLQYFPGITTVENHAILGGKIGVNMRFSRHFFMEIAYGLSHHTEHFITYTDAGQDNGLADADHTPGVVDLDTNEANPSYRPVIDQVGHRYRVQETMVHTLLINFHILY
ncbi:hypothetical protein KJ975_01100 [Myxococcota bacterium]|nr:hypothetical protein [Myxococcota bacterium]